jgi:outer membrane protein assembly factor BamB
MHRNSLAAWLLSSTLAAGVASVYGQSPSSTDWNQWRGPNHDGTIAPGDVPAVWPSAFTRLWSVELGEGYSSPVLVQGRVFVHSRTDPKEFVTAIDAKTGAIVWQQSYDAPFNKNGYAAAMGKGPNATPLVAGSRVFTVGASGHVRAWDAASGKSLWTRDFSGVIDTSKLFCGTSASPVLAGGNLIVQAGSDVKGGLVAALDPATGAVRWEWRGDGPGYATPLTIDPQGTPQLVVTTNKAIVGLEAATGKALWSTPFADEWHENIVTPVWTGQTLVASGTRQGTHAYRIARGATWTASEIWKNPDVAMYMSSPVFADGVIYALNAKRKGQFVAMDAATGAVKWATEGREGDNAAVLLAPKHVLFLTDTGTLVVAKRSATVFESERRYELSTRPTWATPIFTRGDVILRDATSLSRLGVK